MTYVSPQLLEDSEEEDMVGLEGFENTLVRLSRTVKLIPDSPASTVSAYIDFTQDKTWSLTLLSGRERRKRGRNPAVTLGLSSRMYTQFS